MTPVHAVVVRDEFRAMGCGVEVELVGGDERLLTAVRAEVERLEACWSRFRPTSDVCRLNAAQGAPIVVDPATIDLLEAMVHGFIATDGAFDPTLLAPLVGLGYAASRHDPSATSSVPAGAAWRGCIDGAAVDRVTSVAQLPPGTVIDAGGIGKGFAADRVAAAVVAMGAHGAMVSIGGDLRVCGRGPADGGWLIDVADDHLDSVVLQLALDDGGVATSGTLQRAWVTADGTAAHHLLDPATGRPVTQPVVQATVVAGSAAWAEVFTKSLMVGGPEALDLLDERSLPGRVVLADGRSLTNAAWLDVQVAVG